MFGSLPLLHVLLCSLAQVDSHIQQQFSPLACFDWHTHLDSATGCIQLIVTKAAVCGANLHDKSHRSVPSTYQWRIHRPVQSIANG